MTTMKIGLLLLLSICAQAIGAPPKKATPTPTPTFSPTAVPTVSPTPVPTASPTSAPTVSPTPVPTFSPTTAPTASPTPIASDPSSVPEPGQPILVSPLPSLLGGQLIAYTYDASSPPHAPISDLVNGQVQHQFTYDPNGNQISIHSASTTIAMHYNHFNKLETVRNGAVEFKYIYDGNGNRIAKTVGGQVVERYFGSVEIKNGERNRYYFLNGRRIAERNVSSGSLAFYHPDHLGSTSVVTDQQGQEIHRADYYEFGALRSETGSKSPDYAYNDKRRDRETDFYDYGARAYAAKFFKFTSPDSIVPNPGDPQHLNRYAYVNNNPIKYVDPTGHWVRNATETPKHPLDIKVLDKVAEIAQSYDLGRQVAHKELVGRGNGYPCTFFSGLMYVKAGVDPAEMLDVGEPFSNILPRTRDLLGHPADKDFNTDSKRAYFGGTGTKHGEPAGSISFADGFVENNSKEKMNNLNKETLTVSLEDKDLTITPAKYFHATNELGKVLPGDFWSNQAHSGVVVRVNVEEGTFTIANAHIKMGSTVEGSVTVDTRSFNPPAAIIREDRVELEPGTVFFRPFLFPGFIRK